MAKIEVDLDVTAVAQKALNDMLLATGEKTNTKLNAIVRDAVKAEIRAQVLALVREDETFLARCREVVQKAIGKAFDNAVKGEGSTTLTDAVARAIVERLEYGGERY